MPYIEVKTNKAVSGELARDISATLDNLLPILPGKTKDWLMTEVKGDCSLAFGGSDSPCAIANVSLFGKAAPEAYEKLTAALCDALSLALGIDAARIYVKYEEVSTWGWNRTNF